MKAALRSLRYDDLPIGSRLEGVMTVTEDHIVLPTELFNDYGPTHVDEEAARRSMFEERILHAGTVIGIMMGVIGNNVAGTGIADLESTFNFRHPALVGDTLSYGWTVIAREDKPKYQGGILTLEGRCVDQDGDLVVDAINKLLISNVNYLAS